MLTDIDILSEPQLIPLWTTLGNYRENGVVTPYLKSKQFENKFRIVSNIVSERIYGKDINEMFSEYVGADDGHDDLADFIIWHGMETTESFLIDPKTAIPLAKRMSKHEGFDGDINVIRRIIYDMPPLKKTQANW